MMIYYHVLMILCWASQYRGALTSSEVLCILHIKHKDSYYGFWSQICYPITSSYWVTWHIISNKSSLDRSMLARGILAIIRSLSYNYASSVKSEWLITTTKITFLYTWKLKIGPLWECITLKYKLPASRLHHRRDIEQSTTAWVFILI